MAWLLRSPAWDGPEAAAADWAAEVGLAAQQAGAASLLPHQKAAAGVSALLQLQAAAMAAPALQPAEAQLMAPMEQQAAVAAAAAAAAGAMQDCKQADWLACCCPLDGARSTAASSALDLGYRFHIHQSGAAAAQTQVLHRIERLTHAVRSWCQPRHCGLLSPSHTFTMCTHQAARGAPWPACCMLGCWPASCSHPHSRATVTGDLHCPATGLNRSPCQAKWVLNASAHRAWLQDNILAGQPEHHL